MSKINYSSRTEDQTKIDTIIWTVPNFVNLLENKTTREFRTEKAEETSFDPNCTRCHLKMQLFGRGNDIIEIYYLSPDPVFFKYTLTFLDSYNSRSDVIKEKLNYHTVQANKWQYLATMFKKDITATLNYFQSGNLILKFELRIIVSKVQNSNVPEAQLSNDFENLFNNGLFSDFIMKSVEGNEYKVHKAVLATRSPVLKAHFEHNTTECKMNVIESPLEAEVLNEVLTFIYTNKAPSVDDIPEKLLAAADYYQLSKLKSLCEGALHRKLTAENAIETLQLAELYSAKILKQLTLEFIKDGQAKLITKTEQWTKVKSVDLIKAIYEYVMNDDVEADIK
ncbi:unnamed protein product [Euphydryas editha]|uniref:BTB domain-containing protein n=1 Tax=Euphydryas editha TaxID=104508 RepID=A0AAU9TRQ6_EUPED|nr:unnamed protein product [Euphydryas editha]